MWRIFSTVRVSLFSPRKVVILGITFLHKVSVAFGSTFDGGVEGSQKPMTRPMSYKGNHTCMAR